MYHIKITDDSGRTVTEGVANAVGMVFRGDGADGVRCVSLADGADTAALFEILLSLDELKGHIMDGKPGLQLMYLLRNELVEESVSVDMTKLREALADD